MRQVAARGPQTDHLPVDKELVAGIRRDMYDERGRGFRQPERSAKVVDFVCF